VDDRARVHHDAAVGVHPGELGQRPASEFLRVGERFVAVTGTGPTDGS
jgi:hypothetical protein